MIDLLPEQKGIEDLGGTMRLGAQAVEVAEDGTRTRELYGEATIHERHRHRYEVNNSYRERLVEAGLVVSGIVPGGAARGDRRAARPSVVSSRASSTRSSSRARRRAAPLFRGFVGAALDRARARAGEHVAV